ncbi:MAG: hypothetical protein PWP46_103 [Fusobacteriaceae bacterium]|jgi:HD-GYP domain-containing protein (c-di-GMP phosphodiesterase class II)|nr:hypothetical protein [Fusobacteriales bacterium]MDN5303224.1 hypothetical protein [Fusobacteriaceae bacterium]
MKRIIIIFLLLINIVYSKENINILVLHSYSEDYIWTKNIQKGIDDSIYDLNKNINYFIEYMDTKNFNNNKYYEKYKELFKEKYLNKNFDYIITSDDNAFNFIKEMYYHLKNSPRVISVGVNNLNIVEQNIDKISVVVENPYYKKTFDLAISNFPKAKKIFILNDTTSTGKFIKKEVENIALSYNKEIVWLEGYTKEELKEKIKDITSEDIVYLLVYFNDRYDTRYKYNEILKEIKDEIPAPIYVNWDFYLGEGALGGYVYGSYKLGELAINLIKKDLNNENIPMIVEAKGITQYIIDYNVMKKYNLKKDDFPKNTIFLNQPKSYYSLHKSAINTAVIIIILLFIIIFYIIKILYYEKLLNKKNKEIIDGKELELNTQKEIIEKLGDIIETRSKSTSHHVKRVAKLSRYIGKKCGLSILELDILEAAAPMHDVGKIGITDVILNKPAKLTKEEFEKIKEHTTIGYELFKNSYQEILKSAAIVAHQHHEKWDGTGYPQGLKGEEINICARIVSLVDVIDA